MSREIIRETGNESYSINQSSVVDGEVDLEDQSRAVTRQPMLKQAIGSHPLSVCKNGQLILDQSAQRVDLYSQRAGH
jgi:hypothetical protein